MKGNNSSSIEFGAIEAITERPDAPIVAGVDAAAAVFDPDRDLVALASGGDRDAFEALLRRHYERVHRLAWRLAARPDGRDAYRQSWLASELARLDPLLRDTVVLIVGEDLTHAEAARALGVAESTVSWRMHEARRQLTPQTAKEIPDGL